MANWLIVGSDSGAYFRILADVDPPRMDINPPDVPGQVFVPGHVFATNDSTPDFRPTLEMASPAILDVDGVPRAVTTLSLRSASTSMGSTFNVGANDFRFNNDPIPLGGVGDDDLLVDSDVTSSTTPTPVLVATVQALVFTRPVIAGHDLRVSLDFAGVTSTVPGDVVRVFICKDGVPVKSRRSTTDAAGVGDGGSLWYSENSTGAEFEWSVHIARETGTGDVALMGAADNPSQLFLEDTG